MSDDVLIREILFVLPGEMRGDAKALFDRLRNDVKLCHAGMDSLIRERDELRAKLANSRAQIEHYQGEIAVLNADIERLRAQTAATEQKPITQVSRNGSEDGRTSCAIGHYLPVGMKLYAAPQPAAVPEDVARDAWVLQDSRGTVGNAMLFWRKNGHGYTADLRNAETYTNEQAFAQHRVRETDRPWPLAYLLERAGRMVDVQDVKQSEWKAMLAAQRQEK